MVGGGFFSRFGRTMIAQQDGKGIGLLFYTPEPFEDFILRLDFLLPHPRGNNNDNSGVFVRSVHVKGNLARVTYRYRMTGIARVDSPSARLRPETAM